MSESTLSQRLSDAARYAEEQTERNDGWRQIELVLAPDGVHVKGRAIHWSGVTRSMIVPWPEIEHTRLNPIILTIDMVDASLTEARKQ